MNKNLSITISVLIIVLCFVLSTGLSLGSIHTIIYDNSKDLGIAIAAQVHDDINDELRQPIMVAKTMANNEFLKQELIAESSRSHEENVQVFRKYLHSLKEAMNYSSAFIVSDKTNAYYTHEGFNKFVDVINDKHDIWYKLFLEKNKDYDLDVDIDEVNNNVWTVFVNTRVEDDSGKYLGTVGVGVRMENIQSMFYDFENRHNIKINLIDNNGLVLVDSDEINIENAFLEPPKISKKKKDEFVYEEEANGFKIVKFIDALGWYLVIRSPSHFSKAHFLNIILMNIAFTLIIIVVLLVAIRIVLKNDRRIRNVSYTDSLTKMKNRRAYNERVIHYKEHETLPWAMAVLDVNGLKQVNDNIGHQAGDELIIAAARNIRKIYGDIGECFRIGGDEFVVFFDSPVHNMEGLRKKLHEKNSLWHGMMVDTLSISVGYKISSEIKDCDYDKLLKETDQEMYIEKREYYSRSGFDRRSR